MFTYMKNEYIYIYIPWKSKDYFLNVFSVKTIVLVGIYNQQFKGTILFMVFDFQGIYIIYLLWSSRLVMEWNFETYTVLVFPTISLRFDLRRVEN